MIVYIDTSAVRKLILEEPESTALAQYLDELSARDGVTLVSAALLETELRRLADRTAVSQLAVTDVLRRITLVDIERGSFREAGLILPGSSLRSVDALHIAVAVRVATDEFITYDRRQAEAAQSAGLTLVQP
ncbi:type II toxin-antitoxin system VapC family toxin [Cryobacterium sp. SO1]|uniref:type II toxin-antitoxin system VapC family toxin n=1 Tax=Cryobacterium sp. SO1 TaxID=1897061 RepID=UPI001022ED1D|nr:type II toxin-antitoxin system VapC family toxin [Cryobacterium sp. SO1]RZI34569.1 Ribonuclease VapC46 [Cryobacterium sp. SO1]